MKIVKNLFYTLLAPTLFFCSCSVENGYERLFNNKATKEVLYNYFNKHDDDKLFYLSRSPQVILNGRTLENGFLLGPYSKDRKGLYKVITNDKNKYIYMFDKTIYYSDSLYDDLCKLISGTLDIPESFFIGCFDGWIYLSESGGKCYVSNKPDTLFFPKVIEVDIKSNK